MRKVYIDLGVWVGDSIIAFKKKNPEYELYGFEYEPKLEEQLNVLSAKENFNLIYKVIYWWQDRQIKQRKQK